MSKEQEGKGNHKDDCACTDDQSHYHETDQTNLFGSTGNLEVSKVYGNNWPDIMYHSPSMATNYNTNTIKSPVIQTTSTFSSSPKKQKVFNACIQANFTISVGTATAVTPIKQEQRSKSEVQKPNPVGTETAVTPIKQEESSKSEVQKPNLGHSTKYKSITDSEYDEAVKLHLQKYDFKKKRKHEETIDNFCCYCGNNYRLCHEVKYRNYCLKTVSINYGGLKGDVSREDIENLFRRAYNDVRRADIEMRFDYYIRNWMPIPECMRRSSLVKAYEAVEDDNLQQDIEKYDMEGKKNYCLAKDQRRA